MVLKLTTDRLPVRHATHCHATLICTAFISVGLINSVNNNLHVILVA